MYTKFDNGFWIQRMLSISVFALFLIISADLSASKFSHKKNIITNFESSDFIIIKKTIFCQVQFANQFSVNPPKIFLTKILQLTISEPSYNPKTTKPDIKAPVRSNLLPFLMMALGFVLWKYHNSFMKKNKK